MATFNVTFSESRQMSVTFKDTGSFSADFGEIEVIHDMDYYEGSYEATPSSEEQIFVTGNKTMLQNFVVKPIPSNYGLITWNGSYLTVS